MRGPRPAGAAPRPPMTPPPSDDAGRRLRAHLLIGIIVTCVVLVGLIGWKVYRIMHPPAGPTARNVKEEFEAAFDQGKVASREIFSIESRVWGQNKELTAEDFATIKKKLGEVQDCEHKLSDLLKLLHDTGHDDSGEKQMIVPKWLQVKVWIVDASDLLENQKPPEYGGLYIPMYLTFNKMTKAQNEMKDLDTLKNDIVKDPEKIKESRKKVQEYKEAFAGHVQKLQALDDYIKNGLTRPDLSAKDIEELEQLRVKSAEAQMSIGQARKLLETFRE